MLMRNEELENGIRDIEESIDTMISPDMKYTQYLDDQLNYKSDKDKSRMHPKSKEFMDKQEHFHGGSVDLMGMPEKCMRLIQHINSCPKCRKYVLSNIKGYSGDYMIDILIYALTGAFILFLVDMLLKFK